jgi:hypothetical protein
MNEQERQQRNRFHSVIEALKVLKSERPECDSEVEIAIGMIVGKRPGLEEKYDALLMKLDRSYSRLLDDCAQLEKESESPLFHTRQKAKAKLRIMRKLAGDMEWMRARNQDMIKLAERS